MKYIISSTGNNNWYFESRTYILDSFIVGGYNISFYWSNIVGGYLLPIVGLTTSIRVLFTSSNYYEQTTEQIMSYSIIEPVIIQHTLELSGFTMANYSLFPVFFIRLEFRSICDSWISVDLSVFRLFHLQYVIIFDSQILQVWEGERYLPQSVTHSR